MKWKYLDYQGTEYLIQKVKKYINKQIAKCGGGSKVDDALSTSSTNPVQNKVVTQALAGKANGKIYRIEDGIAKIIGNAFVIGTGASLGVQACAIGNSFAIGERSCAEGQQTRAEGHYSHAEGIEAVAKGFASHAEGIGTKANGDNAHAEGHRTQTDDDYSHAEGCLTYASGLASHAEGCQTYANGEYSHAEGYNTYAWFYASHAEGSNCRAYGAQSHAEGTNTYAKGQFSHSAGNNTIASGRAQYVIGEFNLEDAGQNEAWRGEYVFLIGNGTANNARSNAFAIDWNGNLVLFDNGTPVVLTPAKLSALLALVP